jgi:hypothetical protein
MATIKFQKRIADLIRRGEEIADQQFQNTINREIEAKRFLLFDLPLKKIEEARAARDAEGVSANIFRGSKYASAVAAEPDVPAAAGRFFLGSGGVIGSAGWETIHRDLRQMLDAELAITSSELCILAFEAVRRDEKTAVSLAAAIDAAKQTNAGKRAEAQFAEGGADAAATGYFGAADSTAESDQTKTKEPPSWPHGK